MRQLAWGGWAAALAAAVLAAACGGGGGGGGDPVPPPNEPEEPADFTLDEDWVTGLSDATAFAPTPDGRFLVAEQGGALRVVKDGVLLPGPFVQLANVDAQGERGLIGVAVDPDFANNGFVYLHYTTTEGGVHNRVSRLTAVGDAATGFEIELLDLPTLSTATTHNGGALHFGSDGKLYVAVGENADRDRAQDLTSPFGKLLRINSDGTVPADNPFAGVGFNDPRIWAFGLRNPFTFAVQPGTGKIHINDVGQNSWEEINLGAAGANYGWPQTEGPTNASGVTGPLFAYATGASSAPPAGPFRGCSIAGGAFYPATGNFPAAFHGSYFFADFCAGFVARLPPNASRAEPFVQLSGDPVDMRVGSDGALYVLTRSGIARISAAP